MTKSKKKMELQQIKCENILNIKNLGSINILELSADDKQFTILNTRDPPAYMNSTIRPTIKYFFYEE